MRKLLIAALITLGFASCQQRIAGVGVADYFATQDSGVQNGNIRLVPIQTPKGVFRVWTKRFGLNPTIKVLLLHGGPGATHEYFEAFDSYFPAAGIEYYY